MAAIRQRLAWHNLASSESLRSTALKIMSAVLAVVLWELAARVLINNPLFFSSLIDITRRGLRLWQSGDLQHHMWVSLAVFAGGFGLAAVVGIGLGVLLSSSKLARGLFDPWVAMLYATPILALGPLFILWLGIGMGSKIALIFLAAVFPILINTQTGLTAADRTLIEVARSFGASSSQIYAKVRLPSALPYIVAGLRISVARALVGVVVADLFGARAGLGFMILTSAQTFDTAALFVGVIILAFAGVFSVSLLKYVEVRLAPWRFTGE